MLLNPKTTTRFFNARLGEIVENFSIAHCGEINHRFFASATKSALGFGCHCLPIFMAWIFDGNVHFLHDFLIFYGS
jgi:hypothetical protein